MNLLCDEGIDRRIVEALRRDGHEVAYVAELAPGLTDEHVLTEANRLGALLITRDKPSRCARFVHSRMSHVHSALYSGLAEQAGGSFSQLG